VPPRQPLRPLGGDAAAEVALEERQERDDGPSAAAHGLVVFGSAAFAVDETLAALAPSHALFLAALVLVGAATLFFLTSAATYVQLAATPVVRGRVLGIYTPVLLGGHACGALLQGWLAEQLGARQGLAATGALALLATAAVGIALLLTRHGTDP
jgi:MFS family permease